MADKPLPFDWLRGTKRRGVRNIMAPGYEGKDRRDTKPPLLQFWGPVVYVIGGIVVAVVFWTKGDLILKEWPEIKAKVQTHEVRLGLVEQVMQQQVPLIATMVRDIQTKLNKRDEDELAELRRENQRLRNRP